MKSLILALIRMERVKKQSVIWNKMTITCSDIFLFVVHFLYKSTFYIHFIGVNFIIVSLDSFSWRKLLLLRFIIYVIIRLYIFFALYCQTHTFSQYTEILGKRKTLFKGCICFITLHTVISLKCFILKVSEPS